MLIRIDPGSGVAIFDQIAASVRADASRGTLRPGDVAAGVVGSVVRDPVHDGVAWREYLEAVVADREGWGDFYEACRALD